MSFLRRLFGSGAEPDRAPDIDAELERLEAEAERAAPAYVGSAFNRAGDLALRSGKPDRAVACYGRAIDAFLVDAQQEAARGVANKIVRVRPAAVRTLCTLTWLDLAARHHATALLHLRDYVEAARSADEQVRAATQIFAMARLSPHAEFVHAVADALDGLDYPSRASEVRGWTEGGGSSEAIDDPESLSQACLQAAVRAAGAEAELLRDVPGEDADRGAASEESEGA
jgi:tetratricopeptide (TPR) repeat protein